MAFQYLKGTYNKNGQGKRVYTYRTMGNGFKQREGLDIGQEIYYSEGGEALEGVAQRSCGCPIPLQGIQVFKARLEGATSSLV